jgi:stage V sporulation protein SpoVS
MAAPTAEAVAMAGLPGSDDASVEAGTGPSPGAAAESREKPLVQLEGDNVLRVSRNTIPRVLAAKVSGVLATGAGDSEVIITAVGAQALFTSARALALVNEDRAALGQGPVVVTEIRDIGARNAKAFVVAEPDPSLGITHGTAEEYDEGHRFSLRRENKKSVAPIAGALKHAVMTLAKPIQVSSVGAVATSHAVFATFLATSWAREASVSSVILPGRQLLEGAGENGTTLGVIRMVVVRTCDAVAEEDMQKPSAAE